MFRVRISLVICRDVFFLPIKDTLPLQHADPHKKSTFQAIAIHDTGTHTDTTNCPCPFTLATKMLHSSTALDGFS